MCYISNRFEFFLEKLVSCDIGFLKFNIHDKDIALVCCVVILVLSFVGNTVQCVIKAKNLKSNDVPMRPVNQSLMPILPEEDDTTSHEAWNDQWNSVDNNSGTCEFRTFLG